ncbi:MAG: hypothetical protein ABSG28_06335 [Methanoregula sp.]|jgi:hypothetical protein|uniref:hypothetical protein n=1 Tax=Methanoregula sp. TaxID=2052170 RepID=UPI003C20AEDC
MDKIIKITLGCFILILIIFVAFVFYTSYIDMTYRNSLTGTYSYTCIITTDTVISNVTLFLPVPADLKGNSPVVAQISSQKVSGVPGNWTLTLYDTGKATLLKISAPTIGQPAVNGSVQTSEVTLIVNASSHDLIDTRSPVENAAVFRPIQGIHAVTCPASDTKTEGNPECFEYLTSTYADYTAAPSARVSISASLEATNSWTIVIPESNAYENRITVLTMQGENHGWVTTLGWIESGIGSYDAPTTSS